MLEDHRLPQISFQLIIPGAGGYFDPADQPGLAAFTAVADARRHADADVESDLRTARADGGDAQRDGAGATSPEATITGSSLSDQAATLIDLAADVLLHPSFPDDELARFKQRTRSNLAQQRANPNFLAAEMFSRAVYGSHPAARIAPTRRVARPTDA